jgi:hypothetical protein
VFHFPIEDNRRSRGGFIADGEIQALLDEWPEEIRATRANGEWAALSGAIFQTFRRDVHVLSLAKEKELLRYTGETPSIPPTIHSIGSIDWGGANAFVHLWACQIPWADNLWYVYDEYYWDARKQGQRRLDEHAEEIKARTAKWKTSMIRTWADHDPADALMMAHHGVPSFPAVKGANSVREGIEVIQTLFKIRKDTNQPRLMFSERCKMLASQIASYRYKVGTFSRDPKDGEVVKVDDHTVDACKMLILSENVKAYEVASGTFRPNTGPRRLGG